MANQTAKQKAELEAEKLEEEKALTKRFVTCHNGDFIAGEIEFKKGVPVELTSEQQEIPAIKNSIGSMLVEA